MCAGANIHPHVRTLINASNDLGFKLLTRLLGADPGHNVFISSFSVALALAMTYNGAEGETKEAMARVLGVESLSLNELNEANAALMSLGQELDRDVHVDIANSIWARQGVQPGAGFTTRIEDYYDGKFASVNFKDPATADVINRWVASQTRGRIDQLVTPALIELAILVLINAIAFKGIWTSQFDDRQTEMRPFALADGSSKQHPMMSQQGRYDYFETESLQGIRLPYGDGQVHMVVLMPRPHALLEDLQKDLTTENWRRWRRQFAEMEGQVVLPRFRMAYETDLLPLLEELGGEAIAGTDFLGMEAGPLFISKVIHKTFVEVDEEGTEAAAATAVVMLRSAVRRFRMVVDRPFFCAVCDDRTGLLLFMGWILDPTSS